MISDNLNRPAVDVNMESFSSEHYGIHLFFQFEHSLAQRAGGTLTHAQQVCHHCAATPRLDHAWKCQLPMLRSYLHQSRLMFLQKQSTFSYFQKLPLVHNPIKTLSLSSVDFSKVQWLLPNWV